MRLSSALLLALSFLSLSAQADIGGNSGRKFGVFLGGGAQKSISTIKSNSAEAQFEGWGYQVEGGMDLPWSRTFGNTFSIEYKVSDLTNKQKNENSIETAKQNGMGFRGGFFFSHFGLGYGQSKDNAEIHQVSTTTGSSTSKISGNITEIYGNFNIQMTDSYRFTLELQKRDGDLDTYKLDEIKLMMKFFVLSAF